MNSPHAAGVRKTHHQLMQAFHNPWYVQSQLPVDVSADTLPFPDLAVVPFRDDFYATAHPSGRLVSLIVEVADTSLQNDLTEKAELYATAGIPEYWVVDVLNRVVYVLRDPGTVVANGTAYRSHQQLAPDGTITPLAAPDRPVKVADLLP